MNKVLEPCCLALRRCCCKARRARLLDIEEILVHLHNSSPSLRMYIFQVKMRFSTFYKLRNPKT